MSSHLLPKHMPFGTPSGAQVLGYSSFGLLPRIQLFFNFLFFDFFDVYFLRLGMCKKLIKQSVPIFSHKSSFLR